VGERESLQDENEVITERQITLSLQLRAKDCCEALAGWFSLSEIGGGKKKPADN
jgi:hypothetical protein